MVSGPAPFLSPFERVAGSIIGAVGIVSGRTVVIPGGVGGIVRAVASLVGCKPRIRGVLLQCAGAREHLVCGVWWGSGCALPGWPVPEPGEEHIRESLHDELLHELHDYFLAVFVFLYKSIGFKSH